MNRGEIKEFLILIKTFYPRFQLVEVDEKTNGYVVRSQTLDAWYDMAGFKSLDECKQILKDHIAGPEGDKMPGINTFIKHRKSSGDVLTGTAYRDGAVVVYQPDPGEPAKRILVLWTGSAWIDSDGQMWAAPDEEHPEFKDTDYIWRGSGDFNKDGVDEVREVIGEHLKYKGGV